MIVFNFLRIWSMLYIINLLLLLLSSRATGKANLWFSGFSGLISLFIVCSCLQVDPIPHSFNWFSSPPPRTTIPLTFWGISFGYASISLLHIWGIFFDYASLGWSDVVYGNLVIWGWGYSWYIVFYIWPSPEV